MVKTWHQHVIAFDGLERTGPESPNHYSDPTPYSLNVNKQIQPTEQIDLFSGVLAACIEVFMNCPSYSWSAATLARRSRDLDDFARRIMILLQHIFGTNQALDMYEGCYLNRQ